MAFKNVGGSTTKEAVALTKIKQGESVIGYVTGFAVSKHNVDAYNMIFTSEDKKDTFFVYSGGNIRFLINDGKIQPGLLTKVTRIADKMVQGKKSSQFTVEQDADSRIETTATIPARSTTAVDKQAVKNQAAAIAASMKG